MGNISENSIWAINIAGFDTGESIKSKSIANRALKQLTNRSRYLRDSIDNINNTMLYINDSGTSASDVWSASKISSEIAANAGGGGSETGNTILTKIKTVDGSGSGLDADLLDGNDSSYFASSSNFNSHVINTGIHREINDSSTASTDLWSASKISSEIAANAGGGGSETGNTILTKIKTVDGTGSGLDADLLDGNDSSYFASSSSLSSHIGNTNIHNAINDSGTSASDIWSASKISSEIASGGGGGSYIAKNSDDSTTGTVTFSNTSSIKVNRISAVSDDIEIRTGSSNGLIYPYGKMTVAYSTTVDEEFFCGGDIGVANKLVLRGEHSNATNNVNDPYIQADIASSGGHSGQRYMVLNAEYCVSSTVPVLPYTDNTLDLGDIDHRWDDIYATNSTIQTSDERQKENIQNMDSNELNVIFDINPVTFKWKDYIIEAKTKTEQKQQTRIINKLTTEIININGKWTEVENVIQVEEKLYEEVDLYNSDGIIIGKYNVPLFETVEKELYPEQDRKFKRTHFGITSQQLKDTLIANGLNPDDIAAYIHNEETDTYGVRYTELVPLLIHAVKYLKNEIDILKSV